MRIPIIARGVILSTLFLSFYPQLQAQKFKKKKPDVLYARNKKKNTSPLYVGIGTKDPKAQLHTVGSLRFEGIPVNNSLNSILAVDGTGNVFWRDISNSLGNAWFLNGNSITSSHFFGTTNNEDLCIRTNNQERAVFTKDGKFGLGISSPSVLFHTNGNIRFDGLLNTNVNTRFLTTDNLGNVSYRDLNSFVSANYWGLSGNTGANPAQNFIGTTDNTRLAFRTNNIERFTVSATGQLGIGTSLPLARLHVSTGTGQITAFPYEPAVIEGAADTKFTVVTADNTGVGGASILLGHSNFTVAGQYPAYEMQSAINNGRYLRFNYLLRSANGIIQSAVPNIMIMTDNSRVGINLGPSDGALTPNFPTANFHTSGTVRFQGLANGTGNPLVVDNNGNVFVGTPSGAANAWNLTGNAGTNPASNFIGTTDNVRLGIRSNNAEKITVLPNGNVGINNINPAAQFVITNNTTPDFHLRIQGLSPSITLEGSPGPNTEGRIGYVTINNNFVSGSVPGDLVVQTLGNNNLIFGTGGGGTGNGFERGRFNSIGYFGIAVNNPSAKLHVNCTPVAGQSNPSNIRFENLPSGTGSALAIDANGYVYKSNTIVNKSEVEELKGQIDELKAQVDQLKTIVLALQDKQPDDLGDKPVLFQNNPNPFEQFTTIRYYLPEDRSAFSLVIRDANGRTIKSVIVKGKGLHTFNLTATELQAGTYFYSLAGKHGIIDSKKMVLIR